MSLTVYTCHCGQKHYGRSSFLTNNEDGECQTCFDLKDPDEFVSTHGIRCPMCGQLDEEELHEIRGLYDPGETEIMCGFCNYEYVADTEIEVTFTSPERIPIIHGTTDNLPCDEYLPTGDEDHRFECVECKRICCACFGHETDKGHCNDCFVKKGMTV